jgi:glycosyltransferase involved in cell wall biosynthesis/uncharacterized protein (DUF1330 family)
MLNQTSLVSIIIIFFNEERFIEEAIESVLSQTYSDWELLLVDDGSHDKSTVIAKSYVKKYPDKVKYLEHENHQNLGMSCSRNLGIQSAKGNYVCFLDADDIWMPQKLAEQVTLMHANPAVSLVCGRTLWWYDWGNQSQSSPRDFVQKLSTPLNTTVSPPKLLLMFLEDEWATLHDLMIRREAIEAVGGYEDRFRGMYEDQAFHGKLALEFEAFVANEVWCKYRQHDDACTFRSHQQGQYFAARKKFLLWLEAYLKQKNLEDTEIWQLLQRKLFAFKYPMITKLLVTVKNSTKPLRELALDLGRQILPHSLKHWLWSHWTYKLWPLVGFVNFGHLRRVHPIGKVWPNYRGSSVDRYYIEKFLADQSADIRGHVLELADATYTTRFGGDKVIQSDVLHAIEGNPAATIVADLTCADKISSDTFDCIILTQALLLIYDVKVAIQTVYRILRPGGVVLITVPGITQIIRNDMEQYGQYWSFTEQSISKLLGEFFLNENVETHSFGNVLTTSAFLYNLAVEDLSKGELDYHDPDYQLIIGARAVKEK